MYIKNKNLKKQKSKHAHTARVKNYTNIYYVTRMTRFLCSHCGTAIDLFPSMASFFLLQFVQRNGPSHGLDAGEKKGAEFTDKPSPGG